MKMKRRHVVIIMLAAVMVCPYVVFVGRLVLRGDIVFRGVKDLRRGSAYCALSTALHTELNRYYRKHWQYPESLDAVTERLGELEDYEGATAEMLNDFKYEVRGVGCVLWCPERVTYMRRGKLVLAE